MPCRWIPAGHLLQISTCLECHRNNNNPARTYSNCSSSSSNSNSKLKSSARCHFWEAASCFTALQHSCTIQRSISHMATPTHSTWECHRPWRGQCRPWSLKCLQTTHSLSPRTAKLFLAAGWRMAHASSRCDHVSTTCSFMSASCVFSVGWRIVILYSCVISFISVPVTHITEKSLRWQACVSACVCAASLSMTQMLFFGWFYHSCKFACVRVFLPQGPNSNSKLTVSCQFACGCASICVVIAVKWRVSFRFVSFLMCTSRIMYVYVVSTHLDMHIYVYMYIYIYIYEYTFS